MSSLLREAGSLTSDQRRAFLAAFLGWMLDGFDYTILTFVLVDIQRSFTVDNTLAGALGTVTLMFRLVGGAGDPSVMADVRGPPAEATAVVERAQERLRLDHVTADTIEVAEQLERVSQLEPDVDGFGEALAALG